MASSSTHFCTLCQEDDISTKAVSRCLECEDLLCTDCEKHHGRSKTSRQHKVITVAEYGTLPASVLKISNICPQHSDRFERFCSFHGAPCCIQCVSEAHKECELSLLVDVLQNVKESAAVSHLEKDLNEVQKNLEVVENHLIERITKLHVMQNHCLTEIKRVRTSINEHLDTIEKNILDTLSQEVKHVKETIESMASQIESKKRKVVNLQDSLLKTKQYATDLQLFLSIKEMEKQTSEDAKYLEDLGKRDQMADKSLELVISPALKSLQRDVTDFGTISVNLVPSTLKLTQTSQGQAQLSLAIVSTIDTISLAKTLTFTLTGRKIPRITACAILPTGECVFADFENNRLVLYDRKGTYIRDVAQTSSYAYEMCYVKDSIVCISFPFKQKVNFVDVSKNKTVKRIHMECSCDGIDCNDGKLLVRLSEKETAVIMDLDGKIEQRVHIPGKNVKRLAFYKNCIYCINYDTSSEVLCYDMDGKLIWIHTHEAMVKPRSITIDKRSNIIYVAGLDSNSVLAISLDGNQSKIVLSKEDGLCYVRSIHVGTNNTFLVCNEYGGLAFLHQL